MKQEVQDIVTEVATKTAPAGGAAWLAHWWAGVTFTGVLTGVLVILQIAYLLRKWWREETEWGQKLKRWAARHGISKPIELDE